MDGLPEANVFGAGHKPGLDGPPVGLEPQSKSHWIGLTANKARTCVRQLFHKSDTPAPEGDAAARLCGKVK